LTKAKQSGLNSPASPQGIQEVEKMLSGRQRISGFKMPPSYNAFLLRYDGGCVHDKKAGAYVDFLSVADDEKYGYSLMNYNRADSVFMNHEIDTYFPFEPLVIFALDEGSSFWAFYPRQKREDGEMPVRYCDHETGDIYAQAEDFPSFILALSGRALSYRNLEDSL
jgi:hypothetical protein